MTTHNIWKPESGKDLHGKKVAVIGYSHYAEDGEDGEDLTAQVLGDVVSGKRHLSFFTNIRNAFGFADSADFWSRVYFFNYLPTSVGDSSQKYATGSADQLAAAKQGFLDFISSEQPDLVCIFTKKGWREFPETLEEQKGDRCTPLFDGQNDPNWGTYLVGDKRVLVCGFRHPQGANSDEQRKQVQKFLTLAP